MLKKSRKQPGRGRARWLVGRSPRSETSSTRSKPKAKPRQLEHALQRALFQWAELSRRTHHPELEALFSIEHAGTRHISHAADLKRRGVKAGIPDVFLPVPRPPFVGLWIELKIGRGQLSPTQREWKDTLEFYGHKVIICRRLDEATRALCDYLEGPPIHGLDVDGDSTHTGQRHAG